MSSAQQHPVLASFCLKNAGETMRPWLLQPLRADGWLWASDGAILVAVQDDATTQAQDIANASSISKYRKLFEACCGPFKPVPNIPERDPCGSCNGAGRGFYCDTCPHKDNECMCELCCSFHPDANGPEECADCDGSGHDIYQSLQINAQLIAVRYIEKIAALPGAALCTSKNDSMAPVFFRFFDGWGCVMPITPPRNSVLRNCVRPNAELTGDPLAGRPG